MKENTQTWRAASKCGGPGKEMMPLKWYTISLRKLTVARKKIYESVYFEVIFARVLRMLSVFYHNLFFSWSLGVVHLSFLYSCL